MQAFSYQLSAISFELSASRFAGGIRVRNEANRGAVRYRKGGRFHKLIADS
jgi:hypothetical protein